MSLLLVATFYGPHYLTWFGEEQVIELKVFKPKGPVWAQAVILLLTLVSSSSNKLLLF